MLFFLQWIHLFSISLLLGAMCFLAFVIAPTVFHQLPRELAGDLMSKIFPSYYLLGYFCSALAGITLLALSLLTKNIPYIRIICILVMTTGLFYAGMHLSPKVQEVKTVIKAIEDPEQKSIKQKEFDRLHIRSVRINQCVLIATLLLFSSSIYSFYSHNKF